MKPRKQIVRTIILILIAAILITGILMVVRMRQQIDIANQASEELFNDD
jgi:uncharacterized protein YpmB